ncbi:solute carrier family 35 member E2A-like isoform X1 [Pollicipes pollicipes]|uniref:solute carrier family 35 member E2A-like isoform X1 n=1 Tax=Pollicipes pollicipes TaxID=41117 RepID=UPI0018852E2D|nr:solute carrier family 35 member E2A-like isoform X1 [Pollicipes pollicipes]
MASSDAALGLRSPKAWILLVFWYIFSAFTLFTNKYVVSYMQVDSMLLGSCQVMMTVICGCIQLQLPCGPQSKPQTPPPAYYASMLLIGCLTSGVILFGLAALKFVAVSFAETVKSSAPIFTVVISWLVLGERTPLLVNLSLIPVMAGLALCSSHELSFNLIGFVAAMGTNLCECLQSVFVKKILNNKDYKYSAAELQFYPGVAGALIQTPILHLLARPDAISGVTTETAVTLAAAGFFYYCQTATAYMLMEYISPVTYSVANTCKRALLIWLSVLLFHNAVTLLSGLGTAVVIFGVFLYNAATRRKFSPVVRAADRTAM